MTPENCKIHEGNAEKIQDEELSFRQGRSMGTLYAFKMWIQAYIFIIFEIDSFFHTISLYIPAEGHTTHPYVFTAF